MTQGNQGLLECRIGIVRGYRHGGGSYCGPVYRLPGLPCQRGLDTNAMHFLNAAGSCPKRLFSAIRDPGKEGTYLFTNTIPANGEERLKCA